MKNFLFRSLHLHWLTSYALIVSMSISLFDGGIATAAPINPQRSSLTVTLKQMNVPLDGRFKKFSGDIQFNPAKLGGSRAHIEVDTASFDLGNDGLNDEVHGPDWLDVTSYPKATFTSSSIVAAGNDQYSVNGKLTIRGKTQDVIVPVTIKQQHNKQILEGVLPINRTSFDIGQHEWKDTAVVDDRVVIKFYLIEENNKK